MITLGNKNTAKIKRIKSESSVTKMIPYAYHWNDHIIMTKEKELICIAKIKGFSFETADDNLLEIGKTMRNMFFKGISSGNYQIYSHIVRHRCSDGTDNTVSVDPNIKNTTTNFINILENQCREMSGKNRKFSNDLYLTIVRKDNTQGIAWLASILQKARHATQKSQWEETIRESATELEEVILRMTNTFNSCGIEMLKVVNRNGIAYSQILEFLSVLSNCDPSFSTPVLFPDNIMDSCLSSHRLFFKNKHIEIRTQDSTKYAAVLSIKEYGQRTYAGILDGLLQVPFECIITNIFSFVDRQTITTSMQTQQNRLITGGDKAISQVHEITEALDIATNGTAAFGNHSLTVTCVENSLKGLENATASASVIISNAGITMIRESANMEACFWGQLPGNFDFIVRKSVIHTLNLASFISLHNYPNGQAKNNHWGDCVTVFDTTSGTPFFFNFHVRDVGHSLIIGPTGAGKTVLLNFLCAKMHKYNCRMFYFDKDRGGELFIRAIQGKYTVLNTDKSCRFNPLLLPDTSENRNFLLEWLSLLATTNEKKLTVSDIELLTTAIAGNYKLPKKDRRLRNIVSFLGMNTDGSMASRLAMWHGTGSHSSIFDNSEDVLNLDIGSVFGFEMGQLLKDAISLPPILLYLFHRISMSLDGKPTVIVLDEAWALLNNPIFSSTIKDWLKVLRKLNAIVIFATQSVEDASKSEISDTLIQQTATQIFLPNLKATDLYKSVFMLTEREYRLIKTTNPGSRYFLVKQGIDAVIAKLQLSGMDDVIDILSARSETVLLLDQIRAEVGDAPEEWLPIFYERLKVLKAEMRNG